MMKKYFTNLNFAVGFAFSFVVIAMAVISFAWTPYKPNAMNARHRLEAPSISHPLGTDQYGRDTLSRVMYAFRHCPGVERRNVCTHAMANQSCRPLGCIELE